MKTFTLIRNIFHKTGLTRRSPNISGNQDTLLLTFMFLSIHSIMKTCGSWALMVRCIRTWTKLACCLWYVIDIEIVIDAPSMTERFAFWAGWTFHTFKWIRKTGFIPTIGDNWISCTGAAGLTRIQKSTGESAFANIIFIFISVMGGLPVGTKKIFMAIFCKYVKLGW